MGRLASRYQITSQKGGLCVPKLSWPGLALLLVLAGCVTVKVSLFEEAEPLKEKTISGYGRDKVLLMDVHGMVVEVAPSASWACFKGVTTPSRVKEELEKAAKDDHIKAVVLKINSPGGTVSAADVILHELQGLQGRAPAVPVVVCLEGLAASGGYYVAQAGDTIMAYPTCITGSIGVIAMKFNFRGLMDKVGVDDRRSEDRGLEGFLVALPGRHPPRKGDDAADHRGILPGLRQRGGPGP